MAFFFFLNFSVSPPKKSEILSEIVVTDFLAALNSPPTSSIDFPILINTAMKVAIRNVFHISVIVTFSSPVSKSEIKLKTNVKTPLSGLNILSRTSPSFPQPSLVNKFVTHVPNSAKPSNRLANLSSAVPNPLVSTEKKVLMASTICWKNCGIDFQTSEP